MIKFFRDVLNGPLYIIVVLLSIILIMAIIGFMLERKQREKYIKSKMAFVDREDVPSAQENAPAQEPAPTEPVTLVTNEVKEEIPVITDEGVKETNE